jgi:hypothetical protein
MAASPAESPIASPADPMAASPAESPVASPAEPPNGGPAPPPPPLPPPQRPSGSKLWWPARLPAWAWFVLPLAVGTWFYVLVAILDDPGRDQSDCPTGGLSTSVEGSSVQPLEPVPGEAPTAGPQVEIDVEVRVVNRGTGPIHLATVEVGVAGDRGNRITGGPVDHPIDPGDTVTVPAHGRAPAAPAGSGATSPAPDPHDIDVQASWSNPDGDDFLALCTPPA